MTDTTIPTSEVLYRAADLIEERGWGQGATTWGEFNPSGPLCLEGAIGAAIGRTVNLGPSQGGIWSEDLNVCPAATAVHEYLNWASGRYLYQWNDATNRTAAEVIATLRAAAVIEAAKENASAEVREQVSS